MMTSAPTGQAPARGGRWLPDELEALRAAYPVIGRDCAPLCGHTRAQAAVRACRMGLRRDRRKAPGAGRERRRCALMVARWCARHGVGADGTVEACAEACGCTPAMMRMVLPGLLKDEVKRKKKEDKT